MDSTERLNIRTFESDASRSVGGYLAALNDAFSQVNLDPSDPNSVSERLGINKTMSWKLWKMIESHRVSDVLSLLPGASGIRIMLDRFAQAGVSDHTIRQLGESVEAIRETVEIHVSDRATLELVLDGMKRDGVDRLEHSRQLLFRGASGVLGVQAKLRVAAGFLVPNKKDAAWLDLGLLAGFSEVRRLRSDLCWPLYFVKDHRPAEGDTQPVRRPINGATDHGLLPHVGNGPEPDFVVERTDEGTEYVLQPGPIGNVGTVDAYFGHIARHAMYGFAREGDRTNEFAATITAPFERLVADVFIHRSLSIGDQMTTAVFGKLRSTTRPVESVQDIAPRLPIEPALKHLPASIGSISIPSHPAYGAAVERMYKTLGMVGDDFRVVRVELNHPPLGSTVIMRFIMPDPTC